VDYYLTHAALELLVQRPSRNILGHFRTLIFLGVCVE
jgi:hypothetical protein